MKKNFTKRVLSALILLPLTFFFIIKGSFIFNLFLILIFLVISYEWHKISRKNSFYFFGYLFFFFSLYSAIYLRNVINDEYRYLLTVILICIFTDMGGYFFGKMLKGPKIGKISPNKTYSGIFGSFLMPIIFMFVIYETKILSSNYLIFNHNFLLFILLISAVSQIGDLTISYFKRLAKIKDTGKIIPGHGGLLDRFDGMLFSIPFAYIIFKIQVFY